MGLRDERREDLKARLVKAAEARIRSTGLAGLRARDITADAGCALGALYTVFHDMDDLILRVNSITLGRLGVALGDAAASTTEPRARLIALALTYLSFARDNRKLWAALFEHRLAPNVPVPEWHSAELAVLFQHIVEPLSALQPALNAQKLPVRARTLFSAVHGIVSISLEDRFIGLAPADLEGELRRFVDALVNGIERTSG